MLAASGWSKENADSAVGAGAGHGRRFSRAMPSGRVGGFCGSRRRGTDPQAGGDVRRSTVAAATVGMTIGAMQPGDRLACWRGRTGVWRIAACRPDRLVLASGE